MPDFAMPLDRLMLKTSKCQAKLKVLKPTNDYTVVIKGGRVHLYQVITSADVSFSRCLSSARTM